MPNTAKLEPRWPALVAMLAASGVYFALPESLSVGPGWGLFGIMAILMVPIVISNRKRRFDISRILTLTANTLITLAMIASLIILIEGIANHSQAPKELLRSACILWVTNVIVFALWYWKLDAGGPAGRDKTSDGLNSSFLFPQMLTRREGTNPSWTPQFMDYLFLAFNTSTAFSPTDTAVLSRWAKGATMLQSLISLTIVVLLAARAVNIL